MTEPRFLAEPLRAHLRFSPTSRPRENGCNSVSSGTRSRPGGSHKHDMSKEDCKPLQLIASAHRLRSRTHNGGQSGLGCQVKAAKTLMRSRSAGAAATHHRVTFSSTTLGRPLVSPRHPGCVNNGQSRPPHGSAALPDCGQVSNLAERIDSRLNPRRRIPA